MNINIQINLAEEPSLRLLCPTCKQIVLAPTKYCGEIMQCGNCTNLFTVPHNISEDYKEHFEKKTMPNEETFMVKV